MGESSLAAPRLHSLTSLRFFAAAFVVVHHTLGPDGIPIVDLGYVGVTFFFVLSGFVLTWAGSADRGALVSYRNRFARVYPLNLATLIAAALLPVAMVQTPATFIQNLTMTQAWTPDGAHSFNWVSWSISVEAFFYLLFPLAVLLMRRVPTWGLFALAGLGIISQFGATFIIARAAPGAASFLTYDFPPFRLPEFLIGIALALVMQRGWKPSKLVAIGFAAVSAAGAAAVLYVSLTGHVTVRSYVSCALLPLIVLALYAAVARDLSGKAKFLSLPALRRLGDWSFALYMTHMIVLRVIGWAAGADQTGYLPAWSAIPVLLACIAISAAASEFIEKPLERILRAPKYRARLSDEDEALAVTR